MPSFSETFEPLSSPYTATTSLPGIILSQQPAAMSTSSGRMMLSQDGNHQPNVQLYHDDAFSFYTLAITHGEGTAHVFQLFSPKDMVPEVKCLPNGAHSVSWKKL
jgi:hypothetical protein